MSKRSLFTHITPLPPSVSREAAIAWLHNHREMIELNPLIIRYERCEPSDTAPKDERDCQWYEMTDSISYLGILKGEVKYKGAFHNLPNGLQTHVYAPAGLDLREKWLVSGNMPGEPREPVEMGVEVPRDGLYIREDVDMRCNFLLSGFVKKNLNKSHKVLVDAIVAKAVAGEPDNHRSQDDQLADSTVDPAARSDLQPGADERPIQELPAVEARKELAACQCPDAHLPTCSMYVEPTHDGRFAAASDDRQRTEPRLDGKRIPYEAFEYVKAVPPNQDDPELFTGKFHPVSHYHLLFGNSEAIANAPSVQQGKLSRTRAELPASTSSSDTG